MAPARAVLAIDLGASNGRGMVGLYDQDQIRLIEVHRFPNDPVRLHETLYWDLPRLFHEILTAMVNANRAGYAIESVGIDTWGVDYGVLDQEGDLMANPVHYRDQRAGRGMAILLDKIDAIRLKEMTGMDAASYNTINQLLVDKWVSQPQAQAILNTPDLFNYFLTGNKMTEYSMATTTQLYDYQTGDWNWSLIDSVGLPREIFQPILPSGQVVGSLKPSLQTSFKLPPIKVVAVTSHDTASAIRTVATDEKEFLFVATGTWIIVGCARSEVTMNRQVMATCLTNEGGKYPSVNLLRNHVGLWLLQQAKKQWEKEGLNVSYEDMIEAGHEASIESLVDIDDPVFYEPDFMVTELKTYCQNSGQKVPETIGEVVKVIEKSIAIKINETIKALEISTGKVFEALHLFGGGLRDDLLLAMIRQVTGKEVVTGVIEATAYGNVIDQMIALKIIREEDRIRILQKSKDVV